MLITRFILPYIVAIGIGLSLAVHADEYDYIIPPDNVNNAYNNTIFPTVLNADDKKLYQQIFTLQDDGNWRMADRLIKKINNDILMGHVLFQRYMHPTKYRSKYKELYNWLQLYADLPGAKRVYRLALKRKPSKAKRPNKPISPLLPSSMLLTTSLEPSSQKMSRFWDRRIRSLVHKGQVTVAYNQLKKALRNKKIRPRDYVANLGHVARGYFRYKKFSKAIQIGEHAAAINKNYAALAGWWAGLSAWTNHQYKEAAALFSLTVTSNSNWLHDAGIYWAHRAYARAGESAKSLAVLYKEKPLRELTFYGVLRKAVLGEWVNLNIYFDVVVDKNQLLRLHDIPVIKRIVALSEIEYKSKAVQEMRAITSNMTKTASETLLGFARYYKLAHARLKIAEHLYKHNGILYVNDLFPILDMKQSALNVDQSLIHAIIRQESQFHSAAGSPKGAQGMMQLMPATATFIGDKNYRIKNYKKELLQADINIGLGERYIDYLSKTNIINNNLILMIASYNAGPGNIIKWSKGLSLTHDPLLFIESIPARETRIYLERVLANFWIYRSLNGKSLTSLEDILINKFPLYSDIYK